jgi:dimethylamine/trimethylamine dehydrogenase
VRPARHDVLFEPIRLGPKVLKNRFLQTPQCNGAGSERPGMQAGHRGMKAEGGWGGVCTEACSIAPEVDVTGYSGPVARLWDDGDTQNLSAMCDAVHEHGALAGVELFYSYRVPSMETRTPPWAASSFPTTTTPNVYGRHMSIDDIKRVEGLYVAAGLRAVEAGFDFVYVYGAHMELPQAFLSRLRNTRTDEYGGSFENRARFWKETIEGVREAAGDKLAIGVRLAIDTLEGPEGTESNEDGVRFVEHVDHLVDFWDLTIGTQEWGDNAGPSRFFPTNHQAPFAAPVKAGSHTNKPVVGVGRFTDPDVMVQAIESGLYDIIGAARPSIADPFLPRKIEEGRLDDIRECIGCNECVARWEVGAPIVCSQNATAGEEYRRGWHPERFTPAANREKSVLVVGAGPAGLECAVVLGKRGMSAVHLIDSGNEVGGCLNWITKLGHSDGKPNLHLGEARGLGEWRRVVNYRQIQLSKLKNVEVHTQTELSADEVFEYGADLVVIATGCEYVTDGLNGVTFRPIPGADTTAEWQLTPKDVALGKKAVGPRVLVYETERHYMGVTVAQQLAGAGHAVTLVTDATEFGGYMKYTLERDFILRDLTRMRVAMLPGMTVESIEPGTVRLANVWDPTLKDTVEVDSVVLSTARAPTDHLYRALIADAERMRENDIQGAWVIGDAAAPRSLPDVVFDGHRLGREIDSPDPGIALPFIREQVRWDGGPISSNVESAAAAAL